MKFNIIETYGRARRGEISTGHGTIHTPAFVTVGTKGTVKALDPEDLDDTNTQFIFVNTYHIVLSPGVEVVRKAGGIHAFSKLNKPIITDSGGFQVFSLNRASASQAQAEEDSERPKLVKITEDGVEFRSHIDGKKFFFSPEFSIESQVDIGADFIVAFDEDIHNKGDYKYAKSATERVHRWAQRSLDSFKKNKRSYTDQWLYGIIHGARFQDLRTWSSETIAGMDFDCIALGGVSVGIENKELRQEVAWVSDALGDDPRPRHLLGIGTLQDILYAVSMGFDTFDCVLPTRYARMGLLYDAPYEEIFSAFHVSKTGGSTGGRDTRWTLDITKPSHKYSFDPIKKDCICTTCTRFSKAYLHHLFKQKELLAYRLATIHNLHYVEGFMHEIRTNLRS